MVLPNEIYLSGKFASEFCETNLQNQIPARSNELICVWDFDSIKMEYYENLKLNIIGINSNEWKSYLSKKINAYLINKMALLSKKQDLMQEFYNKTYFVNKENYILEMEIAIKLAANKPELLEMYLNFIKDIKCYPNNILNKRKQNEQRLIELLLICCCDNNAEAKMLYHIMKQRNEIDFNLDSQIRAIISEEKYNQLMLETENIQNGINKARKKQIELNRNNIR